MTQSLFRIKSIERSQEQTQARKSIQGRRKLVLLDRGILRAQYIALYHGSPFLAVQEWLSLGFHALALFGLFSGLQAKRKLDELETQQSFPSAF
jgi:hypothetical protein